MPTKVAGLATMIFALRKPMKAMKRPMPAAVPYLRQLGMPLTICSRMLVSVRMQKEQAGEKDDAEGGLPGDAAAEDDGVGEVGVERHAGSEGDGIVGPESHDERGDRGGNAGGEENALDGHAGFGEDARVDDDDVGHGHESGEAGEEFAADGGVIFFEMKNAFEQTVFLFPSNKKVGHYRLRVGWCQTVTQVVVTRDW